MRTREQVRELGKLVYHLESIAVVQERVVQAKAQLLEEINERPSTEDTLIMQRAMDHLSRAAGKLDAYRDTVRRRIGELT